MTEIVQVPHALAANTVLATAALAAQAHANVQTLGGDRPLSLFVLTVGVSGDRKTTADDVALAPVREHVQRMTVTYRMKLAKWKCSIEANKFDRSRAREEAKREDQKGRPEGGPVRRRIGGY
jgi:hypothetical protein